MDDHVESCAARAACHDAGVSAPSGGATSRTLSVCMICGTDCSHLDKNGRFQHATKCAAENGLVSSTTPKSALATPAPDFPLPSRPRSEDPDVVAQWIDDTCHKDDLHSSATSWTSAQWTAFIAAVKPFMDAAGIRTDSFDVTGWLEKTEEQRAPLVAKCLQMLSQYAAVFLRGLKAAPSARTKGTKRTRLTEPRAATSGEDEQLSSSDSDQDDLDGEDAGDTDGRPSKAKRGSHHLEGDGYFDRDAGPASGDDRFTASHMVIGNGKQVWSASSASARGFVYNKDIVETGSHVVWAFIARIRDLRLVEDPAALPQFNRLVVTLTFANRESVLRQLREGCFDDWRAFALEVSNGVGSFNDIAGCWDAIKAACCLFYGADHWLAEDFTKIDDAHTLHVWYSDWKTQFLRADYPADLAITEAAKSTLEALQFAFSRWSQEAAFTLRPVFLDAVRRAVPKYSRREVTTLIDITNGMVQPLYEQYILSRHATMVPRYSPTPLPQSRSASNRFVAPSSRASPAAAHRSNSSTDGGKKSSDARLDRIDVPEGSPLPQAFAKALPSLRVKDTVFDMWKVLGDLRAYRTNGKQWCMKSIQGADCDCTSYFHVDTNASIVQQRSTPTKVLMPVASN